MFLEPLKHAVRLRRRNYPPKNVLRDRVSPLRTVQWRKEDLDIVTEARPSRT